MTETPDFIGPDDEEVVVPANEHVNTGRRVPRPYTGNYGPAEPPEELDIRDQECPEVDELPEASVKVRVLPPFQVAHNGTAHWPHAITQVPESLAQQWIRDGWVTADVAD